MVVARILGSKALVAKILVAMQRRGLYVARPIRRYKPYRKNHINNPIQKNPTQKTMQKKTTVRVWLTVEAPELTITSTGDSLDNVGLPVPLFSDVTTLLPRAGTYALRSPDQIAHLVISSTGGDPGLPLEYIAQIHAQYGYPGIAYNFVVDATGQIFKVTGLTEPLASMRARTLASPVRPCLRAWLG